MDRLQELFDQRLERIQALQDFIVLFGRRKEFHSQLVDLQMENNNNVALLEQVKEARLRMREVI